MEDKRIISSLQYGKVLSRGEFILLWITFGLLFLCPLVSAGIIVTILCGGMNWDRDIKIVLILINIMFCIFITIISFLIYYYKKLHKNVVKWLDDAIETSAVVRRMDMVSLKYKPYQVEFSFEINGQKYNRLSAPGGFLMGLNKGLIKYHNKSVKILYSPKYDQVMILKD